MHHESAEKLNGKKINQGGAQILDLIFKLNPLTVSVSTKDLCCVWLSTVNLNSTILFKEDLIEEIC